MGQGPSAIAIADDAAFGLVTEINRALSDGVIDATEARLIQHQAREVKREIRFAHECQRAGFSVTRNGYVNAGVTRQFAAEDDEALYG